MLVDVIEGQRRHLEVCVSGRDHCRAARDLLILWTQGVEGVHRQMTYWRLPFRIQDQGPVT